MRSRGTVWQFIWAAAFSWSILNHRRWQSGGGASKIQRPVMLTVCDSHRKRAFLSRDLRYPETLALGANEVEWAVTILMTSPRLTRQQLKNPSSRWKSTKFWNKQQAVRRLYSGMSQNCVALCGYGIYKPAACRTVRWTSCVGWYK